jgi:predicted RNA-binding Zn-ribbon protein involved in translation (DUF1610 family)
MTEGFVPVVVRSVKPAAWQAGKPERSIWTGIKLRSEQQVPLVAFRCDECGYLEFYASKPKPPEPAAIVADDRPKTVECLACREVIAADVDRCPHCGWSFR